MDRNELARQKYASEHPEMHNWTDEELNKFLIIGMATRLGFAHVPSFYAICHAALRLGKVPAFFVSAKGKNNDYCAGRNDVMEQIRKNFPGVKTVKMFWLDDDNIIKNAEELFQMISDADKNGWNITTKYHSIQGELLVNCVWRHSDPEQQAKKLFWTSLTDAQIEALAKEQNTDYPVIPASGFGCWYGKVPTDYVFHFDVTEGGQGEDFNFWQDVYEKNGWQLRLAMKVGAAHWKSIPI